MYFNQAKSEQDEFHSFIIYSAAENLISTKNQLPTKTFSLHPRTGSLISTRPALSQDLYLSVNNFPAFVHLLFFYHRHHRRYRSRRCALRVFSLFLPPSASSPFPFSALYEYHTLSFAPESNMLSLPHPRFLTLARPIMAVIFLALISCKTFRTSRVAPGY